MALITTRIRQLSARGRSAAEIAARLGATTFDVCRIVNMQAEQAEAAALQKWKEPPAKLPKPPRVTSGPRAPKPPRTTAPRKENVAAYIPSRTEIREACRQIRKSWSAKERVVRYYLARVDGLNLSYAQAMEIQAVRLLEDVTLADLVA